MPRSFVILLLVGCLLGAEPIEPTIPMVLERVEEAPSADWRFLSPPGWYAGVSVAAVKPNIEYFDFLSGSRHLSQEVTVAPALTLGWRTQAGSAIQVNYRFLHAEGSQQASYASASGTLEFNAHRLDLDYVTTLRQPWSCFGYQWIVGTRVAYLEERERSYWENRSIASDQSSVGIGLHGGYSARAAFGSTGLGLFQSADMGLLGGKLNQNHDGYRSEVSDAMLGFRADIGLSYTLPQPWMRFAVGLQTESVGWHGLHRDAGGFLRFEMGF